jgi:hypothetical protein
MSVKRFVKSIGKPKPARPRAKERGFSHKAKPRPASNGIGAGYPVDPSGRNEWSTAGGVIIDGAVYALQGEPKPYPQSVHLQH